MIETLKDLVRRLDALQVSYMITGSFAMHAYATGRLTYDIDAVIEISNRDAAAFESMFLPDYYVDQLSIRRAIEHNSMFNVIDQRNGVKVDCIIKKPTETEIEKFARRQQSQIDDTRFWVISKEDLILSKLAWAKQSLSEKQFMDIRSLLAGDTDRSFLQRHVVLLGLQEIWAEYEKWKIRTEK
ncbi:MAG: hypothetical protein LC113_02205 [Acidobacteria bacterium]|nr:hypothetical protein [Acidobacteriota bacterium]